MPAPTPATTPTTTTMPAPDAVMSPDSGGASSSGLQRTTTVEPEATVAQQNDAILDLKTHLAISTTARFSSDTGELTTLTHGLDVDSTRGRGEVLVVCPDAPDDLQVVYNTLKMEGVKGITVARFSNCVAAFIVKDNTKALKFAGTTKALGLSTRRSGETVLGQLRLFLAAPQSYSDILLLRKSKKKDGDEGEDGKLSFEQVCEMLKDETASTFNALAANALLAKRRKEETPLQWVINTCEAKILNWIKAREQASTMIKDPNMPGHTHFLDNFDKEKVLNLKGVHYEVNQGILHTTLRDAISTPVARGVPALYLKKTLIFVGKAGMCKSELVMGLCREFCQRNGKGKYGYSNGIDTYGVMTQTGKINELGAIGLYDFELRSRGNQRITEEQAKAFILVAEDATIPAMYYPAQFQKLVPRVWSINFGQDRNGEDVASHWFEREHLEGLVRLVNEDDDGMKTLGSHQEALARRAVIFIVDEFLGKRDAPGSSDAIAFAQFQEEMQNATPLD